MLLSDGEWSMFKQARLIYQPWVQPTNQPPFPHAPNMPKPQPPIHSFPLTRNSGTHKQVSPSYSPLPMVAKFQLVHRICSVNEYWGRSSLQSTKIIRHHETKKTELEGRLMSIIVLFICFAIQFAFCAFLPHILWLSSQECFPQASCAPCTSPQVTNNSILGFAASFPLLLKRNRKWRWKWICVGLKDIMCAL